MKTESEQQEIFDNWKAETNLRIDTWKGEILKRNSSLSFDYSEKSLKELESYLISNYDINSLKDKTNNNILDACISYMGETIIKLVSGSKWHMYLDDKSNVYYGLPCVLTEFSGAISLHYLLREVLNEKNGNILSERIQIILNNDKMFRELIKNQ